MWSADRLTHWKWQLGEYMRGCVYSPAALVSHHQQQQAATSARAPAMSAAAHHTRALAGRPGGLNDATQPPRAINARPPHAPSDTVPPRLVPRPRSPHTLPTDVFPSFHGARALPSFPSDRWPPLIDWARSFAEYVLGHHRRRGLRNI